MAKTLYTIFMKNTSRLTIFFGKSVNELNVEGGV